MRPARAGAGAATLAPPDTLNTMTGGAQALFAQTAASKRAVSGHDMAGNKGKVEGWLGAAGNPADAGAARFGVPTTEPGRTQMSGAAARLLAKTANEKIATFNNAIASEEAQLGPGDVESSVFERFDSVESVTEMKVRAREEKDEMEKERARNRDVRIRVAIVQIMHLPRMDTFGKTDAFCVVTLDNRSAGGQRMKRKTVVVKKNLNPEFNNQAFDFSVRDYPRQVIDVKISICRHLLQALGFVALCILIVIILSMSGCDKGNVISSPWLSLADTSMVCQTGSRRRGLGLGCWE